MHRSFLLAVLLSAVVIGCDDATSSNSGGDDPAVGNPDLELVVRPGVTYENLAVNERQSSCDTTISREPTLDVWISISGCASSMESADRTMQLEVMAGVYCDILHHPLVCTPVAGPPPVPVFTQTAARTVSLFRQFEVAGSDGRQLASFIRFRVEWLGRMLAAPFATAGYEIEFRVTDLTDGEPDLIERLDSHEVSGRLKFLTVSGVRVPVPIPGYQLREIESREAAFQASLTEGHRYEIELRLESRSETGIVYPVAWTSFNTAVPNLPILDAVEQWLSESLDSPFTDEGFVRWVDVELEIGE